MRRDSACKRVKYHAWARGLVQTPTWGGGSSRHAQQLLAVELQPFIAHQLVVGSHPRVQLCNAPHLQRGSKFVVYTRFVTHAERQPEPQLPESKATPHATLGESSADLDTAPALRRRRQCMRTAQRSRRQRRR